MVKSVRKRKWRIITGYRYLSDKNLKEPKAFTRKKMKEIKVCGGDDVI